MSKNIKYSASFLIIVLSLMFGSLVYAEDGQEDNDKADDTSVACTMDAKVCPDGSSVGRVGSDCEFAKCPGEVEIDDNDKDGIKDSIDTDDDNDSILDINDKKPFDHDNDGIPDIKEKRIQLKDGVEDVKNETKKLREENKTKLEALIQSVKMNREALKVELEANKEDAKVKIEEMKAKFKEGLLKVKDENKKLSAEKIVDTITNLNTKSTENLSNKIDQIENVLVSIQSRITKAEGKGLDVTAVKAEVEKAKTAITTARDAVKAQSIKVYTVNVTGDATLKAEMKRLRDAFSADIKAVREKVKLAHVAVRTTATTLAKVPNVDDDEETNTVENNTTSNN